jgi:hypothetical protein
VSLILEALKKLERDKQAPDRGFLVVAHVPWATSPDRRSRWLWMGAVLAGVAILGVALAWFAWRRSGTDSREAAVPSPPPSVSATTVTSMPESLPVTPIAPATAEVIVPPERRADTPPALGHQRTPTGPAVVRSPSPTLAETEAPAEPIPTAAPAATPGAKEIRLQAISERDGHMVAVLNDRLVREGDTFDDVRVLRIGPTEVEIEVNGQRRTLRF